MWKLWKISPKEIKKITKECHINHEKCICLGIYNSPLKAMISKEMTVTHFLIIAIMYI